MEVTFASGSVYVQHNISYSSCNLCGACIVAGDWMEQDRLRELHAEWHLGQPANSNHPN